MIRKPDQMRSELREKMRGGEGIVNVIHLLNKEDFAARIRLCGRLVIPPGASIGMHQHDGEDEIYIIEKGAGMLDDGKTNTPVAAGDAILTGRGDSHSIRNSGTDDLVILAVIISY